MDGHRASGTGYWGLTRTPYIRPHQHTPCRRCCDGGYIPCVDPRGGAGRRIVRKTPVAGRAAGEHRAGPRFSVPDSLIGRVAPGLGVVMTSACHVVDDTVGG